MQIKPCTAPNLGAVTALYCSTERVPIFRLHSMRHRSDSPLWLTHFEPENCHMKSHCYTRTYFMGGAA